MTTPKTIATLPTAPDESPTPSPNDHLKMIVELMRPAGADLARRWLAALLIAPEDERESIVASVEARMHQLYPPETPPEPAPEIVVKPAPRPVRPRV